MRRAIFTRGQRAGDLGQRAGDLLTHRSLAGPVPLAPESPSLAPLVGRPSHARSIAHVHELATELGDVLVRRYGPGCEASAALGWDGSAYDVRSVTFEIPSAVADRLLCDLRIATAAERLLTALDRGHTLTTAGALNALRWAIRDRHPRPREAGS